MGEDSVELDPTTEDIEVKESLDVVVGIGALLVRLASEVEAEAAPCEVG